MVCMWHSYAYCLAFLTFSTNSHLSSGSLNPWCSWLIRLTPLSPRCYTSLAPSYWRGAGSRPIFNVDKDQWTVSLQTRHQILMIWALKLSVKWSVFVSGLMIILIYVPPPSPLHSLPGLANTVWWPTYQQTSIIYYVDLKVDPIAGIASHVSKFILRIEQVTEGAVFNLVSKVAQGIGWLVRADEPWQEFRGQTKIKWSN